MAAHVHPLHNFKLSPALYKNNFKDVCTSAIVTVSGVAKACDVDCSSILFNATQIMDVHVLQLLVIVHF